MRIHPRFLVPCPLPLASFDPLPWAAAAVVSAVSAVSAVTAVTAVTAHVCMRCDATYCMYVCMRCGYLQRLGAAKDVCLTVTFERPSQATRVV